MYRSSRHWLLRRHGHIASICARSHAAASRRRAGSATWRRHSDWTGVGGSRRWLVKIPTIEQDERRQARGAKEILKEVDRDEIDIRQEACRRAAE
jgi:hypothetical protein